jgi:hypothetical protein
LDRDLKERGIPNYMRGGIVEYVIDGKEQGDFLTALFRNEFHEVVSRADENNRAILHNYMLMLCNAVPEGCWGNREKVRTWMEHGGLAGLLGPAAPPKG